MKITPDNFPQFASNIASNYGASSTLPSEHVEAAMERLAHVIDPHVFHIDYVRPQFRPVNAVRLIEFESDPERSQYNTAWHRYQESLAKIGKMVNYGQLLKLVLLNKFAEEAEIIRSPRLARFANESWLQGKAPIIAVKFKTTLAKITSYLVNNYNIPRDKISLIWGGSTLLSGAKGSTLSPDEIKATLQRMMTGNWEDINLSVLSSISKQIQFQEQGLGEIDESLRLGKQTKKERQKEIDRFQSGKSEFCIFTLKSGGVGLSLHHSDELTKAKVRRNPDNLYANLEDIPAVGIRQRETFMTPSFSAIELVQGLGRGPRITSLSDTYQWMIFYKGTVEEHMAALVSMKLRSLGKLVRQNDSWAGILYHTTDEIVAEIDETLRKSSTPQTTDKDDDILFGGEVDEENEGEEWKD